MIVHGGNVAAITPNPRRAAMARPNYRRKNGKYAWHFCTNCPDWPTTDYTTSTTAGDPLCDHCQALEKKGNCN